MLISLIIHDLDSHARNMVLRSFVRYGDFTSKRKVPHWRSVNTVVFFVPNPESDESSPRIVPCCFI